MDIIAGNLCSLLAMAADSISSSRKTARGVLLVQILSQIFYGVGTLILKGYSAVVQNVLSIVRNLSAIQRISSRLLEWALAVLGVVLGVAFNNLGFVGLLPILANLEYTVAVFRFKDNERALKAAFLINAALFTAFNAVILNFIGVISNLVVIVTTAVFLVRDSKHT